MAETHPSEEAPSPPPDPELIAASSASALSPAPLVQFQSSSSSSSSPPGADDRSPSPPAVAHLASSPPLLHPLATSSSTSSLHSLTSPTSSARSSHPLLPHPLLQPHPLQPHPQHSTYHTFPPPSPLLSFEPASPLSIGPTPPLDRLTSSTDGGSGFGGLEPSASLSSNIWEDPQLAEWGGVVAEVTVDDEGEKASPSAGYARPQGGEGGAMEEGEKGGGVVRQAQPGSHRALGAAYELAEREAEAASDGKRPPWSWSKFWKFTGPGWLMSIAYLDPGNLESDLQAGAYTGYQLLWVLLLATLLGLFMQILALRLGVVTGRHLAQMCRQEYPRWLRLMVWAMIECAIIGSDIQEVLGSALAFQILFGLPLWAGVLVTAADTMTFLFLHAFGIRKLEAFFATLITIMCTCFFVDFGYIGPSAVGIGKGFIPNLKSYAILQAVGIIGSIIMPHNMYLHSALVQSRQVNRRLPSKVKEANFYFSIEATIALSVSFAINFAVVCVFARGFFDDDCAENGEGLLDGQCTDSIGLSTAGDALRGLLGGAAQTVWGIGLLASGQSSTMTGVTTGQYVMSGFLSMQLKPWQRIILTRSIALVPSVAVALSSLGEQTTFDATNQAVNVVQSVLIPFAILPLLHFTSSRRLMGSFVNTRVQMAVGWTFAVVVIAVNFFLVASTLSDAGVVGGVWVAFVCGAVLYLCMIGAMVKDEMAAGWRWVEEGVKRLREAGMGGGGGGGGVGSGGVDVGTDAAAGREARLRSGVSSPASPASSESKEEEKEEEEEGVAMGTPSVVVRSAPLQRAS